MPRQIRTLLIGLGNEHRGDDAVGPIIVSRLQESAGERLQVLQPMDDLLELIDAWKHADSVIVIDAARSGGQPGTIHRLDASKQPLPRDLLLFSTHAFSVAQAIELARVLRQLPRRVIVYGIEGENFDAGQALTPAVEQAGREVESLVLKDIEAAHHQIGTQS